MNIITKLFARYRERRDRKFRERIDRVMNEGVYFLWNGERFVDNNPQTWQNINEQNKNRKNQKNIWGQSFDGIAPIYSKEYLSVNGSNSSYRQEAQKD